MKSPRDLVIYSESGTWLQSKNHFGEVRMSYLGELSLSDVKCLCVRLNLPLAFVNSVDIHNPSTFRDVKPSHSIPSEK